MFELGIEPGWLNGEAEVLSITPADPLAMFLSNPYLIQGGKNSNLCAIA